MWDTKVVELAVDNTPSEWENLLSPDVEQHLHGDQYDPLIRRILVQGINKTWTGNEVNSWIQCPTTSGSSSSNEDQMVLQSQWDPSETDDGSICPWHWATPIQKLTCEWVWPKELEQPPYNKQGGPLLELHTEEYAGKITDEWVVEKLLAMGGLRLASILNLIFAQQSDH